MTTREPPRISIQLLSYVADWLVRNGVAIDTLLKEAQVDSAWLGSDGHMIPLANYIQFFERAAVGARLPHLGLKLGQFEDVGSLGALGYLFMSAPSLLDAFSGFTSHLHALQEGTINRLSMTGDAVMIEYQINDNSICHRRQDAEYSIAATNNLVRLYSAGKIWPREVYFEHRQAGSYATYHSHFGCDIFFEQSCNMLVYDREGFNIRSHAPSSVLGPIIASHLDMLVEGRSEEQDIVNQVTRLIDQSLADEHLSQRQVARRLGMSIATLGRRLKARRESFRSLVIDRRMATAERLLVTGDRPISHVALAVGYGENASFARIFRRRNGVSPSQFRRMRQQRRVAGDE